MAEMIVVGAVELEGNFAELIALADGGQILTALMQGGLIVERAAKQNVQEQGLIDTGNLRASIRTESLDPKAVMVGTGVEYAAIHELGGDVHPTVTDRMRRFGWAKYRETGDPKFKAIALTRKTRLDIHIPARPYLRPALDENREQVIQHVGSVLRVQVEGVGK